MLRKRVGYGPSRLAIAGLACSIAGLLFPIFNVYPAASSSLLTLGVWILCCTYLWYALNIYDLRKKEPRITAVLMLTIPIVVSWVGKKFLEMLGADPSSAVVLLVPALAVGSAVSLITLWLLSTLRRGTLRLFNQHERRRRWPSLPWIIGSIIMVSLYSLSPMAVLPVMSNPAGLIQGLYDDSGIPGFLQDPGIAIPTIQRPIVAATPLLKPQASPTPSRADNSPITIAHVPATVRQSSANTGAIEQAVVSLTNQERQTKGLPALQWDGALASIARAHSQDMAANSFMSHTNLRGQDPTARAVAAGYDVRRSLGGGYYTTGIGENIDMMPTGNVIGHGYVNNDPQSVAQAMVQAWMNSPGHRENILRTQYARIGVGVAYDGTLYYYGTQNFI